MQVSQAAQHAQTLVDVLMKQAELLPTKTAYIFLKEVTFEEQKITFFELDRRARAIAAAIQKKGFKVGDRALLIFAPGIDLIAGFFGCLYAGVIAVPVYPPLNDKLVDKIQRVVENSLPKFFLASEDTVEKFKKLRSLKQISKIPLLKKILRVFTNVTDLIAWDFEKLKSIATDQVSLDLANQWKKPDVNSESLAFLQYTSGSTMHPKGVMVTHGNLLDNLSHIYRYFGVDPNLVGVSWLPPYHDMGLIGGILEPAYAGTTIVLMSPFAFLQNPLAWLKSITKYKANISGGPNFAYDYCVKRIKEEKKKGLDLSSWKLAFNGAEPVRSETLERFYEAFKDYGFRKEAFYPCYGLAEATLLVSGKANETSFNKLRIMKGHYQDHKIHLASENDNASDTKILVSSGETVMPVKIVDPDTFDECSKDMVGEIWVHSPSVAKGYWQDKEKTHDAFAGKINGDSTATNYLRTGDLGFLHNNELYVSGRIKDLIIMYGKNHYPQDIELTVQHSHDQIRVGSCAAFVTEIDDEYKLTVVCEVSNKHLDKESQDKIFHTIFEKVYAEHQLQVDTIALIPPKAIPKTTSGKIRRNFCRKYLLDKTLPVIALWNSVRSRA